MIMDIYMKYKKIGISILTLTLVVAASLLPTNRESNPKPTDPNSEFSAPPNTASTATTPNKQTPNDTNSQTADRPTRYYNSKILSKFKDYPEVRYYLLETVSDPLHSSTWSHDTIQAERAWDLSTGSSDVTIAVIDSGYALNHQELANKWHINDGEQGTTQAGDPCWTGTPQNKQSNNCDDDQNGRVDDWRGYDFFHDDNDVSAGTTNTSGAGTQHGTLVAGTIGAAANNGAGSAGIDHSTKIMPLQVFDDDGNAFTSDIVAAIEYATDNGADIINLSLGSNGYDAPMEAAVQYAVNAGVLVVAASGNCALNDEEFCNTLAAPGRMTYPALYDETLAVGATTNTDTRASYSSYGSQLDLVAPGSGITPLPTYAAGNQVSAYATASGTSFAAPLTAGVAGLLLAQNQNLTPIELDNILTTSTDLTSGMSGNSFTTQFGYGRLNAHKATLMALASTQVDLELGTTSLSPRQPAIGNIWRSTLGSVANDESVLIGCRVAETDICSATSDNGTIIRFSASKARKGDEIQYIFIRGSVLGSGSNVISVHNREYATEITSLTK